MTSPLGDGQSHAEGLPEKRVPIQSESAAGSDGVAKVTRGNFAPANAQCDDAKGATAKTFAPTSAVSRVAAVGFGSAGKGFGVAAATLGSAASGFGCAASGAAVSSFGSASS